MLIKFCKPEHNPLKGCNTFRFGTLEYYRNLDPAFLIADSEEGQDSHFVEHYVNFAENKDVSDFFRSIGIIHNHPDFYMNGINLKRTYPNCYVWSCKYIEGNMCAVSTDDGFRFDKEYTSYYNISDPNSFAQFLSNILMNNFKVNNFSIQAIEQLKDFTVADLNALGVRCFHGRVIYVKNKQGRLSFNGLETYARQIPDVFRPFFVKTEKYKDDSEYRFVFEFCLPQKKIVIPVAADPLDAKYLPIY